MSNGVTFFFSGKDNTTRVFKNVNKSMKTMEKSVKSLKTSFSALSAVVSATVQVIKTVVTTAVNLVVSIVKKGLSLIKKLVTSAFNFIKTALSTLLSWFTKALGKVFDGIGTIISKSAQTAVKAGKTAIKTVVSSIQAYADKQYNSIQLQVSLGDDFDKVNRDFKELLQYTTADRNDLWSVMATYAEMGKTAKDITKYTRATIYLANATGKSLDSITRMLLTQEALSRDVEKTLKKYGVNVSDIKDDVSIIDKIIAKMGPEMEKIRTESLSQSFANVKNDIIALKEKLGELFAGPVKKITDKIHDFLQMLLGKDTTQWTQKIDQLFTDKIEPIVDKIITFLAKIVKDPQGFFNALWQDIQTIFSNIKKNLLGYISILGVILGELFGKVIDILKDIDFKDLTVSFAGLADALEAFILNFGKGAGWFDGAETSLREAIINAWNKAHPDFTLSTEDKWYKNLGTMLDFAWENAVVPAWDWIKDKCLPGIKDWWMNKAVPVLKTTFEWLGEVLSSAFTNLLLQSETLRTIMSAIGMPIATTQDQKSSYEAFKQWLPKTAIHGNVWDDFGPSDLTSSFLKSAYNGDEYFIGTWGQYLENVSKITGEELNILRRISRADSITESATVPNFRDLMDRIDEALNGPKKAAEETTETVHELPEAVGIQLKPVAKTTEEMSGTLDTIATATQTVADAVTQGMKVTAINGQVALPIWTSGGGAGGGGIQDYFATSNEFKIHPYSLGGWAGLNGPEVALLGENGPEYVVPNNMIGRTTGGGGINNPEGMHLNSNGTWYSTGLIEKLLINLGINTDLLDELIDDLDPLITPATSALQAWSDKTVLEDVAKETAEEIGDELTPWYKKIWNGIKGFGKGVGGYLGTTVGFLGQNGAFGSHMGNIISGIMDQLDNKSLTIWSALGEVIKEFLPYLQKGLELVGGIFDQAFEIAGNAVMNLGEEIGQTLMPILEAFIPFMKTLSDVIIALAPVVSSTLAPAVKIIALILNILTGLLDGLMPVIAAFSAVIQWVSDAISYAIGSVINWLASWIPWIQSTDVKKPKSVPDYYWDIMDSYNESKANGVTGISTTAVGTASQTASYSGATTIHIHNDFNGSYIVGQGGMRDLALIIKNTLEDIDYTGQTV